MHVVKVSMNDFVNLSGSSMRASLEFIYGYQARSTLIADFDLIENSTDLIDFFNSDIPRIFLEIVAEFFAMRGRG